MKRCSWPFPPLNDSLLISRLGNSLNLMRYQGECDAMPCNGSDGSPAIALASVVAAVVCARWRRYHCGCS